MTDGRTELLSRVKMESNTNRPQYVIDTWTPCPEKEPTVFFQAEDGIRDLVRSRGLGDVYKRQPVTKIVARQKTKLS